MLTRRIWTVQTHLCEGSCVVECRQTDDYSGTEAWNAAYYKHLTPLIHYRIKELCLDRDTPTALGSSIAEGGSKEDVAERQ